MGHGFHGYVSHNQGVRTQAADHVQFCCCVGSPVVSYSDTLLPSGLAKVGLQIDLHQTCETFGVLLRRPFEVHIGTERWWFASLRVRLSQLAVCPGLTHLTRLPNGWTGRMWALRKVSFRALRVFGPTSKLLRGQQVVEAGPPMLPMLTWMEGIDNGEMVPTSFLV